MEKKTIVMEIHGRPDLTRDLSYGTGRAMNRVVKRIVGLPSETLVTLVCEDTEDHASFYAGELLAAEGLIPLAAWCSRQAKLVGAFNISASFATDLLTLANLEPVEGLHIFLDMDGVFADFDVGYPAAFGHHHTSVDGDTMWSNIDGQAMFYRHLAIMPCAKDFYDALSHGKHTHEFLSVCRTPEITLAKRLFLSEKIKTEAKLIPVWAGPKADWMNNKGDILIDDHENNIDIWNERGGVGILHTDFPTTTRKLLEAIGTRKETPA